MTLRSFSLSSENIVMTVAEEKKPLSSGLGMRHLQCVLLFCAVSVAYSMRVNLSVAIVAMTDKNSTNPNFPEYIWSEQTKSKVLSSFFCGYIFTQIPSGHWARRFGGKIMLLGSVLGCGLLAIATPFAASIGGWKLVCATRALQGLVQGTIIPSTHTLLSKWAPVEERGTLATYSYSGSQFGTVAMLASSGVLASSSLGWPSIFYIPGILSVIWAIFWIIWGANSPNECKRISDAERNLIETSLQHSMKSESNTAPMAVPWVKIFTSVPFLVLLIAHSCYNWGFWTLLTQIPSYMKNVLNQDIKSNALLSALPYFGMLLLGFVFCGIANVLEKHKTLSLTASRKVFNTIGQWIPMVLLIVFSYVGADQSELAVVLLTAAVSLSSATHLGFQVNHIDLSPNFAGTLVGMTNCVANMMSIIAPLVVGYVVTDTKNPEQWRTIFYIAGGFYFVGNLLFIVFGKAEVQPWNHIPHVEQEMKPLNGKQNTTEPEEIPNEKV